MNETEKGRWLGILILLCGVIAILTERAGLTLYARAYGDKAKIAGILMIVLGTKLIFPMLFVRKKNRTPREPEKKSQPED